MPESGSPINWPSHPWVAAALRRKLEALVSPPRGRVAAARDHGSPSEYRSGSVIFYRGHEPLGCYLLLQGRVALESGHGNRAARGVIVEGPVMLGAWHAEHGEAWPVTARALTPALVAHLPRVDRRHRARASPVRDATAHP